MKEHQRATIRLFSASFGTINWEKNERNEAILPHIYSGQADATCTKKNALNLEEKNRM